jgi:hypothetical protein
MVTSAFVTPGGVVAVIYDVNTVLELADVIRSRFVPKSAVLS